MSENLQWLMDFGTTGNEEVAKISTIAASVQEEPKSSLDLDWLITLAHTQDIANFRPLFSSSST